MIRGKIKDKAWEMAEEKVKDFVVSAVGAAQSIAKEIPKDAVDIEASVELPAMGPLPKINLTIKIDLGKV